MYMEITATVTCSPRHIASSEMQVFENHTEKNQAILKDSKKIQLGCRIFLESFVSH